MVNSPLITWPIKGLPLQYAAEWVVALSWEVSPECWQRPRIGSTDWRTCVSILDPCEEVCEQPSREEL